MKIKVSFFFALYDFWVGFFFDTKKHTLYMCLLPCLVFKFEIENNSNNVNITQKQKELFEKIVKEYADTKESPRW